jgi:hypothetical protein
VNRHAAASKNVDFPFIDIEAQNIVADIRETRAGDETDPTRSDNRDFHTL